MLRSNAERDQAGITCRHLFLNGQHPGRKRRWRGEIENRSEGQDRRQKFIYLATPSRSQEMFSLHFSLSNRQIGLRLLLSGRKFHHHRHTFISILPTILRHYHSTYYLTTLKRPPRPRCPHTTAYKSLRVRDLHRRSLCQHLQDKDTKPTTSPSAPSSFTLLPPNTSAAAGRPQCYVPLASNPTRCQVRLTTACLHASIGLPPPDGQESSGLTNRQILRDLHHLPISLRLQSLSQSCEFQHPIRHHAAHILSGQGSLNPKFACYARRPSLPRPSPDIPRSSWPRTVVRLQSRRG